MSSVAATTAPYQPYVPESDIKLGYRDTIAPSILHDNIPRRLRSRASQADERPTSGERPSDPERPFHGLSSAAVLSSIVEDAGDSLQLVDHAQERSRPVLDHNTHSDSGESLNVFIRHVMAGPKESLFLPLDELDMIVTMPNICRELELSGSTSDLQTIASQVWRCETLQNGDATTRRKLFVILCLMEDAASIEMFIEGGIFDADLPFEFEQNQCFCRSGRPINLFSSWKLCDIDNFKNYQGQVMAPYFKLGNDLDAHFREYKLHSCVALPFVDHELKPSARGNLALDFAIRREGGYSIVRKVRMHSAHHDQAGGTISEKRYFAVKELRKQTEILGNSEPEPDRETTAYKYLNCRRHPHIIQLLATFTQKGHLNMIFPWADGNLHEFWQSHFPKTSDLTRDASLARWMMGQFLGLAEAICCIHHSEALDLPEYNDVCRDRSKTNGRHGDIKPENILWFKSGSSRPLTQSLGKLLISDLGSTEFHATRSKTIQAEAAGGFTHTYRAPEFDRVERVAPKADIWSFGCVLLQFLVWYMHGWDRVDSFAQARSNDSNLNYHADHFFNFDQSDSTVVIKASVTTMCQLLREVSPAPDFVLDLLDFVEIHLLEPDSSSRVTCDTLVTKFKAIQKRCLDDLEYCIQRTRKEIFRAPTDLSHKTSVSLSSEMQKEYRLNINPNARVLPLGFTTPTPRQVRKTFPRTVPRGDTTTSSRLLVPLPDDDIPSFRHSTGQDFGTTRPIGRYSSLQTDDGRVEAMTGEVLEGSNRIYKRVRNRARAVLRRYFKTNENL